MLLPSSSFFPPLYYSSIFSPIVHILHLFFVSSSTSSSPIPPPHQHISSHPVHSPHISNRVKDVPSKSIPPQRVKIKIPRFHSTPHPPLTTSSLAPDSFKSPRMLTRRVNPAGGPGVTSSRPQDRLRHPLPARHRPFLCKSTQAATTKGPFENLCKSKSRIISNNRWHPIYAVCEASIASHTDCSNLTRLWLQRAAEQTDGVNYPAKEFAGSL